MSESKGFKDVLGVEVEHMGDGRARLRLDASPDHLNEAGTVHGGVLASLVDMAMGEAEADAEQEGRALVHALATFAVLQR